MVWTLKEIIDETLNEPPLKYFSPDMEEHNSKGSPYPQVNVAQPYVFKDSYD